MSHSMVVLLAARTLLGLAVGGFWALSASLAMRLVPSGHLPRALSMIFGGGALFVAAAVLSALAFGLQAATLPSMPAPGQTKLSDLISVIKMPHVSLGMVGVVLMFGGSQCFATYVRPFLQGVTHLGVNGVSAALLLLGVSNFIGTTFAGRVLKAGIRKVMSLVSLFMAFVAAGLYVGGRWAIVVYVLIVIWGLLRGIVPVGWSTWLTQAVANRAESGGGILVAVIQIAIMAGAAIGGIFVNSYGDRSIVALSGALLLLGWIHVRVTLQHV